MSSTYDIPRHCLSIGDDILVRFFGDRNWSDAKITEARGDHECEVVLNSGERNWIQLDKVEFMPRDCNSARKKTKVDGMERGCSMYKGNCSNDESEECATKIDHKENTTVNMTCGQLNVKIQRPSAKVTSAGSDASQHVGDILHEQLSGNSTLLSTYSATADAICSVCQSGAAGKFLVQCKDSRCSLSFLIFCLHPPVETIKKDWSCPNCSGCSSQLAKDKKQIAKRIHRIFGYKKVNLEDKENGDDEFLIKWASLSHHHDTWIPRAWLYIFDPVRLHSYGKKTYNMDGSEIDERKPEWYNIDRVIACRKKCVPDKPVNVWEIFDADYGNGEFEYFVKWTGLDYSESTWESNCTTELLDEVKKLIQRHKWAAERVQHFSLDIDVKPRLKISNELYGDTLYDYQLQGLNWLLGNFKARKNVILADEMGLGKTVQVVTFINYMKQERLNINPVLILAPKSILFQWEKMLPRLVKRGNRVLLFSQMTKMLDILEDFLLFLSITYFRIDGGTSIASRQQQMKDFNNPESQVFVFLMSTRAGGLGIDLPTADRVIIYDPDFNPFMDLQAQSRAHRIGQTRPVVVYQLITKCSVEVKILQKSKEKLAIENLIMNQSKKVNVDELHSMLLHGVKTILNRKNVKATLIQYDDAAIDALLKLDPAPDEICPADDDHGYLGTIQSFAHGNDADAEEGESNAKPDSKEWENILGPVRTNEQLENFGKGKRQRKLVAYECESSSGSEDVYSPESSSSSDDSEMEDAYYDEI